MARLKDTVIPLGNYPSGTREFGPLVIGNSAYGLGIEVQRCTSVDSKVWDDPATTVQWSLELSLDNGQTWNPIGGAFDVGGIRVGRNGETPFSWYWTSILDGSNRRLRGSVTVTNGPIRTSANVIVDEA